MVDVNPLYPHHSRHPLITTHLQIKPSHLDSKKGVVGGQQGHQSEGGGLEGVIVDLWSRGNRVGVLDLTREQGGLTIPTEDATTPEHGDTTDEARIRDYVYLNNFGNNVQVPDGDIGDDNTIYTFVLGCGVENFYEVGVAAGFRSGVVDPVGVSTGRRVVVVGRKGEGICERFQDGVLEVMCRGGREGGLGRCWEVGRWLGGKGAEGIVEWIVYGRGKGKVRRVRQGCEVGRVFKDKVVVGVFGGGEEEDDGWEEMVGELGIGGGGGGEFMVVEMGCGICGYMNIVDGPRVVVAREDGDVNGLRWWVYEGDIEGDGYDLQEVRGWVKRVRDGEVEEVRMVEGGGL